MSASTIGFKVGGVDCPNNNGIGAPGANGGVFNCGLIGTTFELYCPAPCTTGLRIVELKLFRAKILTVGSPGAPHGPYKIGATTIELGADILFG